MSNILLVSDLHLTDSPLDEYRWNLFPWLREAIHEHNIRALFMLGDLTTNKDYHSSKLVNRIVSNFVQVFRQTDVAKIYILRGNHDGLDPATPYFHFLGLFPSIHYVATPYAFPLYGREILMLPHTRDPKRDWQDVDMGACDTLMMHATVAGSLAENGMALEGIPPALLHRAKRADIYSGDIHVPQKMGNVEYVGAPYPIRFGDTFEPRAILLRPKGHESLPVPGIRKHKVVLDGGDLVDWSTDEWNDVYEGDQVKVVVRLAPADFGEWNDIKKGCKAVCDQIGATLCGMELEKVETAPLPKRTTIAPVGRTPEQAMLDYATANNLATATIEAGKRLLRGEE